MEIVRRSWAWSIGVGNGAQGLRREHRGCGESIGVGARGRGLRVVAIHLGQEEAPWHG